MTSRPRPLTSGRRRRRRRFLRVRTVRRLARSWWRTIRMMVAALMASPPGVRFVLGGALILLGWFGVNWLYHTIHKPAEILFPLDDTLNKSPRETWRQYGSLFREHSTAVISPELLAALAQVEGAGNPVARTYWRWRQTWNPLEMYRPASSAVGMYQITDGTFREGRRLCIHDHAVVEDGPWHDLRSCWFNSLYTRVLPSHAIELTAAWLDWSVAAAIGSKRPVAALQRKQDLAAVIHLCGAGAGHAYAKRGFRLLPRQRCGDHDVRAYLSHVNVLKQQFLRLAAGGRLDQITGSHS